MAHYDETTLVVKHLPHELDAADRVDFLKHLGAVDVSSIISEQKKSSLTFARFRTPDEAKAVLKHLHQQEVWGRRLSVEFAKAKNALGKADHVVESNILPKAEDDDITAHRKIVDAYLRKLHSWTNALDFMQPPPLHLRYLYPPPTAQVLKNICRVMARSTKFYTQVLHLMNKMNLPCPFSDKFDVESDLVGDDFDEPEKTAAVSEEDSEMESDNDIPQTMPQVKPVPKKQSSSKRLKFFHSKVPRRKDPGEKQQPLKPEQVFETTQLQASQRKIELKVPTDLSSLINCQETIEVTESIRVMAEKSEPVEENVSISAYYLHKDYTQEVPLLGNWCFN